MDKKGTNVITILLVLLVVLFLLMIGSVIREYLQNRNYDPRDHICEKIDPNCNIYHPLFKEGYCCVNDVCEIGGCLKYHRPEECEKEENMNDTEKCVCEELIFKGGEKFNCSITENYRFYENRTKDVTPEIQYWCNYAMEVDINKNFETTVISAKRCREINDFDMNCTELWEKYNFALEQYLAVFNAKGCKVEDFIYFEKEE